MDSQELRRRIKAQLDTLADAGARLIILGAWGCGAFLAPPALVAQLYQEEISRKVAEQPEVSFKLIVFAIYHAGYGSDNFAPFQAAFESFQIRPPQLLPNAGSFRRRLTTSTSSSSSTASSTRQFVWRYFDPQSGCWSNYPEDVNAILERRYLDVQHGNTADFRVSVTSAHFVDVGVWRQFNAHDESKWRAVQRVPSSDETEL